MTVLEERITQNNGRAVVTIRNGKPTKHAAESPPEPPPVPTLVRNARRAAVVITAGIAVASFVLNFAGLTDLAQRSHIPERLAWLWPLSVDGTIVQATVAIIALAAYPTQRSNRRFFWSVLVAAALVSVGGNVLHILVAGPVPPVLAALVATVAPLSLLATTHGLAILVRFNPEKEI